MAIELFSENSSLVMSPRISFSHDLSQSDIVPIEQTLFSSNSNIDFDFCIVENQNQDSSSADELFSNGKIIPQKIPPKKINNNLPKPPQLSSNQAKDQKQNNTKSFWGFKRSNSLNCGSGYAPSLCPLPLLSRSSSTGSVKKSSNNNHNSSQRQNLLKNSSNFVSSNKSNHQKPPLKKCAYGYYGYGNGVRVNPVLNVPSANLFGLGSIFSNKTKKK